MKTGKPLVSVVFPVKNEQRNIEECLRAVRNQSYKNIELVVVDGMSSDKTVEIAKKFHAKVFYENPPICPGNARNIGAEKAKGSIVAFIDADNVVEKDYIKKSVEVLEDDNIQGVSPKTYLYPTSELLPRLSYLERDFSKQGLSPLVVRRSAFLKVKFNAPLVSGDDYDFGRRFAKKFKFIYMKKIKTFHKEPNSKKIVKESLWFGRTYPDLLLRGGLHAYLAFLWVSAVAVMIPLTLLSLIVPILRFLSIPLLFAFLFYSVYKIRLMWRRKLKFLFPFYKILRYSLMFCGILDRLLKL